MKITRLSYRLATGILAVVFVALALDAFAALTINFNYFPRVDQSSLRWRISIYVAASVIFAIETFATVAWRFAAGWRRS